MKDPKYKLVGPFHRNSDTLKGPPDTMLNQSGYPPQLAQWKCAPLPAKHSLDSGEHLSPKENISPFRGIITFSVLVFVVSFSLIIRIAKGQ